MKELTFNEEYLIRLLNFETLAELNEFLTQPDDPEALTHMEPPDDLYEEITKAEEDQELVETLERLFALSVPPSKDGT